MLDHVVFVFNVSPTAKVIWRRGHGLKSHPTDWWSRESNLRPLVYKASGLSIHYTKAASKCRIRSIIFPYTLAHKHQFKILLKERCEIDYLHRLVLTSMWSENRIINLLRSLLNFGNPGLMSCSKSADHLVFGSDCGPDRHILSKQNSLRKQACS